MRCLIGLFMSFLFFSCSSNEMKKEYEQLKSEKITIPDYEHAIIEGKDSLINDCFKGNLKLVIFTDSTSCNSCSVETIYNWEELVKYAERYGGQLDFYFIFTPKKYDVEDVQFALTHTTFKYPLILDSLGLFRAMNPHIPTNKLFHTFLLNEENRVIMVGNPLHNSNVRKLFEDIVEENLSKK